MSAVITYNGKLPKIELGGYGHFSPGDSKTIDHLTAVSMDNDACRDEGWSVSLDGKKSKNADEPTKPAAEAIGRRSSRNEE